MAVLPLLFITLLYQPELWRHYPPLTEIGSVSFSTRQLFIAVPEGVYILDRPGYRHTRTLTSSDGITDTIRFCAYNPFGGELLIAGTRRLYSFIPATGQLLPLNPPFSRVRSIGIAQNGAFFETENGIFQKIRTLDRFQPASELRPPVRWFGERDTASIRRWTFLSPYHFLDPELNLRPLTRAWPDERAGRLYVASPGYGIIIYNLFTGIRERELRPGPPVPVVRILEDDRRPLFLTRDGVTWPDAEGNWQVRTDVQHQAQPELRPALLSVIDLQRREEVRALVNHPGTTLVATGTGIYTVTLGLPPSRLVQLSAGINDLALLGDTVIIATDRGLVIYAHDSLIPVSDPFARADFGVYAVAATGRTLFFGTVGRILMLDTTNTWTQLIPPGFDLSRPVRALTAAANYLFAADRGTVQVLNLKTGTWLTLDGASGLPEGQINGLYADDRYLWIAGSRLLSRYEYRPQLR